VANEDAVKKVIMRGAHDILPNHVVGGMDATEGTYVWDHIQRGCSGGEWEELYKGKLGILKGEVAGVELPKGSQQLYDPQGAPRGRDWWMLDTGNSRGAQAVPGGRNERRA
jgi:hypothetical protein